MKKKKGFTLVELLAVIVILAVILIIAVPQIMNTIKTTRLKSIEDSARLIATNAEKDYLSQQAINQNYNATSIPCSDVAKLSDDYASCTITYNDSGVATVKLKGANGGKFSGVTCTGTKDNMKCKEKVVLPGYSDAVELLTSKIGTGGLIKDDHNELRYQGINPDNYVTFNDEEAGWRIVGLFNVDGEQRVKLVRKDSIGRFSWDSSDAEVNSGYGINQWGPSTYTNGTPYEGADVMRLLNNYYYNGIESGTCYSSEANKTVTCTFTGLTIEAKKLIETTTWYLGGGSHNSNLTQEYKSERQTSHVKNPSDAVIRTDKWQGMVGLVYPSDFGYASGNSGCANNLAVNSYCNQNWMENYGWTITSSDEYGFAYRALDIFNRGISYEYAYAGSSIHPSVYLIPGVQIKGSGTTADPYVFAE